MEGKDFGRNRAEQMSMNTGLGSDHVAHESVNTRMTGASNGLDYHALRPFSDAFRGAFGGAGNSHPYGDLK